MKRKNVVLLLLTFFTVMAVLMTFTAPAAALDDSDALRGVKTGKAVFDVNVGDPAKLALYLSVIKETHQGLVKQGVKPDMIVVFRGPSIPLVSTKREGVPAENLPKLDEIAKLTSELKGMGAKIEACGLAARLQKVDPATILSDAKVVANTFISLIAYENKGYALVAIQ
jgi:intracellular sulfur oxidation DsrE/DsrF family protein